MTQDATFANGEALLIHRNRLNANATDAENRLANIETVFARTLYVDNTYAGSFTADGSINRPFTTIQAATTFAATLTPSEANKIRIVVRPGHYTEDVVLSGHIFIEGGQLFTTVVQGSINVLSVGAGLQSCGLSNIEVKTLAATANNTLNFVGITGDLRVYLERCRLGGNATNTGRTLYMDKGLATGIRLTVEQCVITHDNATNTNAVAELIDGDNYFFRDTEFGAGAASLDAVVYSGAVCTFKGCDITGRVIGTGGSLAAFYCFMLSGIECINTDASSLLSYTSLSTPSGPAIIYSGAFGFFGVNAIDFVISDQITGNVNIISNKVLSNNIKYEAAVLGDWPETSPNAPATLREALDVLAARGFKYVVGPAGSGAPYTTVQAAVDAAELAGGVEAIIILPDTYTENVTISKPGINLRAWTGRSEAATTIVGNITISSDAVTRMQLKGFVLSGRLILAGTFDTVLFLSQLEISGAHATDGVLHMTNSNSGTTAVIDSSVRITNTAAGPAIKSTAGARLDGEGCRILASSFAVGIDSNGDILLNNAEVQGSVNYTGNGAFKVIIRGAATSITSASFCLDLGSAGGGASALIVGAYLVNFANTKVLNGSGTNITYGGILIPDGFGTLNSTHGAQMRQDGVKVLNDTGSLTGLLGNLGDYESASNIRTFLDVYSTTEVDTLVDASLKVPEAYDPAGSGNFPTTYGGNAVEKGDSFRIVTADTLGTGTIVNPEDLLIANTDTPGQTDANWQVVESNRSQATETVKGVAEIATQAEVDTGTDDERIITPAKLAGSALSSAVSANTAKVSNATHTGDVTGSTALTIANDVVSNAKLANMPASTIKGNDTGSPGDPKDLSVPDMNALLGTDVLLEQAAEINARTQVGMVALTNTNGTAGTWADVTAALLDGGAGSQTMFPGLAANNAFYIGADQLPNAIGYVVDTALVLGGGDVSVEYWNGASWTALKLMESDASDLSSNINNILLAVGTFHLRHNEPTDSALLSLDGNNKHWIRIIIGTAITTSPILDNANWFKDGRYNTELFGSYQRLVILNIYEFQDVLTRLVGNTDVPAGPNTGINKQNNLLQNNAYDSFGVIVRVPEDVNTAIDAITVLSYQPDSTDVNNWEGRMALAKVKDGDVADGTLSEQTVSTIIALDGTQDIVKRYQESFDVEDVTVGDDLQFAVGRDATGGNANDLYTGGIAARVFSIAYKRWK